MDERISEKETWENYTKPQKNPAARDQWQRGILHLIAKSANAHPVQFT